MAVTLAPLDKSEAHRVLHLELGTDQEDYVGKIADMVSWDEPDSDFHIVLEDDVVVGFFKIDRAYPENYAFARPGELGIRGVLIDKSRQGHGVGAAAMSALPAYAARHYPGAPSLVLTVNCNNPAAQRVYLKAGFLQENDLYLGGRAGPQFILRRDLHSQNLG